MEEGGATTDGHRNHVHEAYAYDATATASTANSIVGVTRTSPNDEDDHNDDDNDDLDAFLVALEKRCRSDFASCDLSRSIQQSSSSSSSTSSMISTNSQYSSPADFMRKLRKVFPRAEKNVKLNCLVGMLALDDDNTVSKSSLATNSGGGGGMGIDGGNNDGRKVDQLVHQLLTQAEEKDDEMWVRVIAGIVRSIMFRQPKKDDGREELGDGRMTTMAMDSENVNGKMEDERDTESGKQLRKIVTEILHCGFEESIPKHNDSNQNNSGGGFGNGVDVDPLFVPMHYALLSPSTLCTILPEVGCIDAAASTTSSSFATAHFSPNMDASILHVDALAEDSRSRDEEKVRDDQRKELLAAEKQQQQQQTNGHGLVVDGRNSNGSGGRGPVPPIGRGPQPLSGQLMGRGGRFANMAGRDGRGGRGINNHGASSSSLFLRPASSAVGRGGLAAGRGRMDGRVGGRSSSAAVAGRSGSLSRLLGTGGGGRGRGAVAVASSAAGRGGGSGGGVKMLDASDVEGLNRERAERESLSAGLSSVEARKMERKRKLMEDAAASGLKRSR